MCIERIDRESVQPSQLQLLNGDGVVAYGFVGKAQTELSFEPVAVIQDLGERANLLNLWRGAQCPLISMSQPVRSKLALPMQMLSFA